MARSFTVVIAISMGIAGCAHGPSQPSAQASKAIAIAPQRPPMPALPAAPSAAESSLLGALADAPRHAQNSANASVGEYVPKAAPSAAAPRVPGLDPDFSRFDGIKRSLNGESDLGGPGDQGTSERDRKVTSRIRKAVLADPRLSYNAKGVAIVTKNGRVTLRGVVNNSKERSALEEITARLVGSDKMTSEVKIK